MKQVRKLKLSQLSKNELEKKELKKLKGVDLLRTKMQRPIHAMIPQICADIKDRKSVV